MSRETDQIYKWGYEEGMKIGYEETKRETAIPWRNLEYQSSRLSRL